MEVNDRNDRYLKYILFALILVVTFREIIALYTSSFIKFIPDLIIWVMLVYIVVIKNKFKFKLRNYDILFILFLIVGFVSTILNKTSLLAYALQFRSITTMYALFYCIRNIELNEKDYRFIGKEFILILLILCLFSFIEFISNKCLFYPKTWAYSIEFETNFERVYSLLNNPNTFSMYLIMVVMLISSFESKKIMKIPTFLYCIVIICVLLSGSRSAFIAIVLVFVYLMYLIIKNKKYKSIIRLVLTIIISIAGLFALNQIRYIANYKCDCNSRFYKPPVEHKPSQDSNPDYVNPSIDSKPGTDKESDNPSLSIVDRWDETLSGKTKENSSFNGRIYNIKLGLKIMKENPIIGTGFGTYGSAGSRMVYPKMYETYKIPKGFYSDNDYIKIMVETGILGTLVYAGFVLSMFWSQKKNIAQLVLLFIFFFMGMFYNITELQVLCMIFYILFDFQERKIENE